MGAAFGWWGGLTELATEIFEIPLIYPYGKLAFSLRRVFFKGTSAYPGLCLDPQAPSYGASDMNPGVGLSVRSC
jgi:hypothetical protein